jgi:hypothetical protein
MIYFIFFIFVYIEFNFFVVVFSENVAIKVKFPNSDKTELCYMDIVSIEYGVFCLYQMMKGGEKISVSGLALWDQVIKSKCGKALEDETMARVFESNLSSDSVESLVVMECYLSDVNIPFATLVPEDVEIVGKDIPMAIPIEKDIPISTPVATLSIECDGNAETQTSALSGKSVLYIFMSAITRGFGGSSVFPMKGMQEDYKEWKRSFFEKYRDWPVDDFEVQKLPDGLTTLEREMLKMGGVTLKGRKNLSIDSGALQAWLKKNKHYDTKCQICVF